jgi:hypothetical protein
VSKWVYSKFPTLYIPKFRVNLLSINKIDKKLLTIFYNGRVSLYKNNNLITIENKVNNIYYLPTKVIRENSLLLKEPLKNTISLYKLY